MLRLLSTCHGHGLFFVLVLVGAPATATSVIPLDDAALHARADLIVEGTVVAAEAAWVGRRIVTFHRVQVVGKHSAVGSGAVGSGAVGKSAVGQTVVVAVPGGVVDDVGQVVFGAPRLAVGTRYRFFLGAPIGPHYRGSPTRGIVGIWQGVFVLGGGAALPFDHPSVPAELGQP